MNRITDQATLTPRDIVGCHPWKTLDSLYGFLDAEASQVAPIVNHSIYTKSQIQKCYNFSYANLLIRKIIGLLLCFLFLFILLNLKFEIFPKVLCHVKMDLHCISGAKYSIFEGKN